MRVDECLERRFPESKQKAYCLMSIREHLLPEARKRLNESGLGESLELAKVARRTGIVDLQKSAGDTEGSV